MGLLRGKTALITGGSRGIGEAIVLKYASEGADVVFTYVSSEEKALAVKSAAESLGVESWPFGQMLLITGRLSHWSMK